MSICQICKRTQPASKQHLQVCHREPCKVAFKDWCAANFDLLSNKNKHKTRYEDAFWEVTPEQKKQFSRFYELMKPRSNSKKCKCLKCRRPVGGDGDLGTNYRLCPQCHRANQHIGALAYA